MRKHLVTVLSLIALLSLLLPGCAGTQATATPEPGSEDAFNPLVSATGVVVPAQWATIAMPISGQVVEVLVEESQLVEAGQALVRFDDRLLMTQLTQALASLSLAKANFDLVAAGTPPEQRQAAITAAGLELESARQALQTLNDKAGLVSAQAEQLVAAADKALDHARDQLDSLVGAADPEDIDRARAQVVIAADRLKNAKKDYDRMMRYQAKNVSQAMLKIKVADAQTAHDAAVTRLNNLLGHANRYEVALAEANVKLAEAALADAQSELEKVKDGPDPDALALAQARLSAAQASLAAAQALPAPEQLAVARQQVEVSQAAIDVLQAQLEKLVVAAPFAGMVSAVRVRQGEWVNPGAPVLLLADLASLRVETTDLNEIDAARVSLDDPVKVTFDALPEAELSGRVVRISPKSDEGSGVNYTVVVALEAPPAGLRWGMTAFVDIEVQH
jgi:multidrug efflux pump subunit AcrA (membrane-fusion protein)